MSLFERWQNPLLTLGERCIAFAESEMTNGIKEDHLNSFTSPRIREYFSICTRKINNKETKIKLISGNWCASSASYTLYKSLLPGETPPHGYRAGVVEIVSDLQKNGLWRDINNSYKPRIGDIVVFDRSQPNKPETAWWRHVGRVYYIKDSNFKCISGNCYGCWKVTSHTMDQKNLLGFGEYPDINSKTILTPTEPIDWSNLDISQLVPMEDTGKNLESFFDIYEDIFNVK